MTSPMVVLRAFGVGAPLEPGRGLALERRPWLRRRRIPLRLRRRPARHAGDPGPRRRARRSRPTPTRARASRPPSASTGCWRCRRSPTTCRSGPTRSSSTWSRGGDAAAFYAAIAARGLVLGDPGLRLDLRPDRDHRSTGGSARSTPTSRAARRCASCKQRGRARSPPRRERILRGAGAGAGGGERRRHRRGAAPGARGRAVAQRHAAVSARRRSARRLQVITLLEVLLLYYFDLRRDALVISAGLLCGTAALTLLRAGARAGRR